MREPYKYSTENEIKMEVSKFCLVIILVQQFTFLFPAAYNASGEFFEEQLYLFTNWTNDTVLSLLVSKLFESKLMMTIGLMFVKEKCIVFENSKVFRWD